MKDREYIYTVAVRGKKIETPGQASTWEWSQQQFTATSMVEVSRLTGRKMDDLQYITKEVIR